jgi:hypothetical protein
MNFQQPNGFSMLGNGIVAIFYQHFYCNNSKNICMCQCIYIKRINILKKCPVSVILLRKAEAKTCWVWARIDEETCMSKRSSLLQRRFDLNFRLLLSCVPEVYFYYFHCEQERKIKPLVESGNWFIEPRQSVWIRVRSRLCLLIGWLY